MLHLLWLLLVLPKLSVTVRPPDQGAQMAVYMLEHPDSDCRVELSPGFTIFCITERPDHVTALGGNDHENLRALTVARQDMEGK